MSFFQTSGNMDGASMNYIVVDFEWNQSSYGRRTNPRIPFEIIEIGAVMLDDNLQEILHPKSLVRTYRCCKWHDGSRTCLLKVLA